MQVSVHEAKTHLSRLIEKVIAGEEVIISKRNKPVVRLMPLAERGEGSRIGGLKGSFFKMGDSFDDTKLNDELADRFREPMTDEKG